MSMRMLLPLPFLLWISPPLRAADIPIPNAGFEQVVLPCAPGDCQVRYNAGAWTGTGNYYTFKPATGPGKTFLTPLPDGVNVAALDAATLSQTLGSTLQPDTTYTLEFYIGARTEFPFPGYLVELLAGSTTIASDSSLIPATGTFTKGRIAYTSGAGSGLLGQPLGIRLTGYGRGGQTCFDLITLDATPAKVTSSIVQLASGGGWKTTLTLVNLSSNQRSVNVTFRRDDGTALALPLSITQRGSSLTLTSSFVDRTIDPRTTLVIESEAPIMAAATVGWANIVSSGPLAGFAIFRQRGVDGRDSEGTAVLTQSSDASSMLMFPYDNTAGFITGVALVNPTDQAVVVNALIRDENGAQVDLQAVALPAMGHTAFSLTDRFPSTVVRRGIIEFRNNAGGVITGLGLRFSSNGSFTSVPVVSQ